MEHFDSTRERLLAHAQQYPKLQIQDVFKFIHQSALGCEHMAPSLAAATERIQNEAAYGDAPVEPLDGAYSRVPLSYLSRGLRAETLAKLFVLSAKSEADGHEKIEQKLLVLKALAEENALPFSPAEIEAEAAAWRALGFPPMHHSEVFRAAYRPAYRVISNDFVPFLPLLARIDALLTHGSVTLAVEGGSASGKSTLGALLEKLYDCTLFHMDDFFLRPEMRTSERLAEVGGNVDRERFLSEVLLPLQKRESVHYRRFDCSQQTVLPAETVQPKPFTVIEGAYSMHPELADYYNLSVFLDVSPAVQKARIEKRNTPPMAERFFGEWIPLEEIYFAQTDARSRCALTINIDK